MKHDLLWTNAATATVSFALGWALTPKSSPSQGAATTAAQSANSISSDSTSSQAAPSEEATVRSRVAKRDETKKSSEPRISIPLTTIAETIRDKLESYYSFQNLQSKMAESLTLLGTSERGKYEILELLKKTESEIYTEEKKLLKVVQTDGSEIHLDNQAMEPFSKRIALQIQDGIRTSLPADFADVLISSTQWDKLYPTGEKSFPVFTITRALNGKMTAWVRQSTGGRGTGLDSKYLDDGTPIAADEVFQDERWRPFLKGLTLLPKDEE